MWICETWEAQVGEAGGVPTAPILSLSTAVVEGEPTDISRRVDDTKNDRLTFGHSEVDVLTAENRKPEAWANGIARHTGMPQCRQAVEMCNDFPGEAPGGLYVLLRDEVEDVIDVGVRRLRDDQLFRRNRASPRETISAVIASAPRLAWYSPRRWAASASSIFDRSSAISASYSSIR